MTPTAIGFCTKDYSRHRRCRCFFYISGLMYIHRLLVRFNNLNSGLSDTSSEKRKTSPKKGITTRLDQEVVSGSVLVLKGYVKVFLLG